MRKMAFCPPRKSLGSHREQVEASFYSSSKWVSATGYQAAMATGYCENISR